MRRLLVSGIVLAVGALAGAGSIGASTINGTEKSDRLDGTPSADVIRGLGGDDVIDGLAGNDVITGGDGRDQISGGEGNDQISVSADRLVDRVVCGPGADLVNAELSDVVAADCEVVSRQLSRDPYGNFESQHETQVEPDSFSFGRTIVTAFQSGRVMGGGAANIGYATSHDAGATWKTGFLPGLTLFSSPGGIHDIASDPVVAYDARHLYWLIATLARASDSFDVLVSRSRDGLTWSAPITAIRDPDESLDKEWIACDNWPKSRFRGRCYLSYLGGVPDRILTRSSNDGGLTWSGAVPAPGPREPGIVNGAMPVPQPSGALVVVYSSFFGNTVLDDQVSVMQSTDGGASFSPIRRLAALLTEDVASLRAPPLVSAEIDKAGRIYVAWSDCRFRDECSANDIVLSKSLDGQTWTEPVRVPTGPTGANPDYWVPGIGVDVTTAGTTARVAVSFQSSPYNCGYFATCLGVDVGLVTSTNGGKTWTRPQRLNVQTMPLDWIAETSTGRMVGDYISTSFAGGRAVPVFSLAAEPVGGTFRQAIFAATYPVAAVRRR